MTNKLPYEEIKRKEITKKKSRTLKDYGCYPDKRDIPELIKYIEK